MRLNGREAGSLKWSTDSSEQLSEVATFDSIGAVGIQTESTWR